MAESSTASVDDVINHMDHVIKIAGVETVGFGSDQPPLGDPTPQAEKVSQLAAYQARNLGMPGADPLNGHVTSPDLDRADRMLVLETALARRGHRGANIEKILGGNFIRVFGEVVG